VTAFALSGPARYASTPAVTLGAISRRLVIFLLGCAVLVAILLACEFLFARV
jgi:hypothetical protein